MTRDTVVPSTSVADVAHHGGHHKPGTTNGLLGEIEPMSPDSPKNAVSPATLGGEAQRPLSSEFKELEVGPSLSLGNDVSRGNERAFPFRRETLGRIRAVFSLDKQELSNRIRIGSVVFLWSLRE